MGPSILTLKSYSKTEKGYKPDFTFPKAETGKISNDAAAYMNDHTTITPLKINWTAKEILLLLKNWDLE